MAKKQQGALPAGYTDTSGSSKRGKTWEPGVGDTLEGVVVGKEEIDAKKAGRQKAKKGDKVTILRVADSDGEIFTVWESHSLQDFCKTAKPRDAVFIRLDEIKKLGRGKDGKPRILKVYTSGIKSKGAK